MIKKQAKLEDNLKKLNIDISKSSEKLLKALICWRVIICEA